MHIHIHTSHDDLQDGLFDRMNRQLETVFTWLTGPAMSEQERFDRVKAEVQSEKYGHGIL